MTNENQNTIFQSTTSDNTVSASESDETLINNKRYADYFPDANEVCPRCQCADYQALQDTEGRNMRQCISCGLLYLPPIELCPRCRTANYLSTKNINGRQKYECKKCGQSFFLDEKDLQEGSDGHNTARR